MCGGKTGGNLSGSNKDGRLLKVRGHVCYYFRFISPLPAKYIILSYHTLQNLPVCHSSGKEEYGFDRQHGNVVTLATTWALRVADVEFVILQIISH